MSNIKYIYKFKFNNGVEKEFNITLDSETLHLITERKDEYPSWTKLKNFKCSCCPLNEKKFKYCPVITSFLDVIEHFKDSISYERVDMTVQTPQRTYMKNTSLQEALNSLIGIYMPTSGCPILERLKPMVQFHLPFATLEETNFRMMSTYLFAQYFIFKEGGKPDWKFKNLTTIYNDIRIINKNFCNKLTNIRIKDASINALITLDCFAFSVSYSIDTDKHEKLKQLFTAYL